MPHSSDEVIRQARERRQQQVLDCSRRAAKKILAELKGGRPNEATLAELIAGELEELNRTRATPVTGLGRAYRMTSLRQFRMIYRTTPTAGKYRSILAIAPRVGPTGM